MIGHTVSHYIILEKLGEGGMGVVYKAEDTKLKRTVALKFLLPELTRDKDARERFIHEAQAAAALDHPDICTIHEIDEARDQTFISMAYIDGERLKDKIDRGPLKLEEALEIAIHIAQGLQAAHEKGIVHRDIKSANIMIASKGRARIMDFGLAQLSERTKITKAGVTVGTPAYMSPEQSRGERIDHRTDIWSLGVMLYEMVTGRLPFQGDYDQAVVYQILNEEPEPITSLRANVPMELDRVVKKAIQKDRCERYQRIEDLLVDLRSLRKEIESGVSKAKPAPSHGGIRKRTYLYVGSVVLIVVVSTFLVLRKHPPEVNPNMSFRAVQVPLRDILSPGLSSDGNWIAFPSIGEHSGVYFMNAGGDEPRCITVDSLMLPFHADISPDGSRIVYDCLEPQVNRFSICTVSSLGGMSNKIAEIGFGPRWHPDGERIGYTRGAADQLPSRSGRLEFWSVRSDGSDDRLEFVDSISTLRGIPAFDWSPDGKSIAWIRGYSGGYEEVVIHELGTGSERQLTFDKKRIDDVCWAGNGQIIFSSDKSGNTNLWTIPNAGGEASQITKGIGPDIGITASADSKKLVFLQQQPVSHIWIVNSNGAHGRQITLDARVFGDPSLSPDNKHIACVMRDLDYQNLQKSGGVHVYLMDRDGGSRRQQTYGLEFAACPAWSPDGKWIAYSSRTIPVDSSRIYLSEASRPGTPKLISHGLRAWWLDTERLIVLRQASSWLVSRDGTETRRFYQDSTWAFPILREQYVLFYDLRRGREGWWIVSVSSSVGSSPHEPKKICSTDFEVLLAPSGKVMIYVRGQFGSSDMTIWRVSLPDGSKERIQQWESSNIGLRMGAGVSSDVQMSYDGKEIIYSRESHTGKLVMIENPFR